MFYLKSKYKEDKLFNFENPSPIMAATKLPI